MRLLIKNIKELIQIEYHAVAYKAGKDMQNMQTLKPAWLLINDDKIADFGDMNTPLPAADKVIDATGKMVFPCFCDSHTHIIYKGSRE